MATPTGRRMDAINGVLGSVVADGSLTGTLADREALAARIRGLYAHGRTTRWNQAVSQWAAMVENAEAFDGFRWAIFQGAVYASHAA